MERTTMNTQTETVLSTLGFAGFSGWKEDRTPLNPSQTGKNTK